MTFKAHRNTKATTTTTNIPSEREFLFDDIDAEININQININILSPATNTRLMANRANKEILACISITEAWTNLKKMSITSRRECVIELQSIHIFGINRDNQYRPILVKPLLSSSSPMVHVEFELFTANPKSDNRLNLIMEPFEFIYDAVSKKKIYLILAINQPIKPYFSDN
ncbi:unnamed protein product [Rotaria sp. Silwood2]|nr:unnamed protein product [Rotaria sp. Silwood2]CAF2694297.1 unnamed protein product [Rotaria sp. Silwood2]CAF3088789.1 unnamed protein product [Rotaria sp. Silwood2]CAF4607015.1 unnamed protein product [Rotaria sp. Silwood2]